MPQVLVWRANDGRLFEDVNKYRRHLKKLANSRYIERKVIKGQKIVDYVTSELFPKAKSFDEIAQIIIDHWTAVYWAAYRTCPWELERLKKRKYNTAIVPKIVSCRFDRSYFSESVSNSHVCPANGVTNWRRNELFDDGTLKPTGYPGVSSNILIELSSNNYNLLMSRVLTNLNIKTGSGSGGKYSNFSCSLFADEFPELWNTYQKQQMWKKLTTY